ncbi:hypothetical protein GX563_09230 [Candidatus Bathyarchaeota archaeon]|nr:hypothetical protein [Candidatus Bathyarchaeota archaeon]
MKKSALFLIAVLISLSIVSSLGFQGAIASSSVSGIISSNATWSREAGPWNLTGNVLIENGVTVTVEDGAVVNLNGYYIRVNGTMLVKPGVTINTQAQSGHIEVNGVFSARGTSANPIHIYGAEAYTVWIAPPVYSSIQFSALSTGWNEQSQSGSIIEYSVINSTVITIDTSLKLANNVIDTTIESKNDSPIIYKNTIKAALSITGGSPTITANTFDGGRITFYGDNGQENVVISNNVISKPSEVSGGAAGLWFGGSWGGGGHVLVEKNLITDCYYGIQIFSPNFANLNTALTVKDNAIRNNQVGLYVSNRYNPTVTGNNIVGNVVSVKMVTDYSGQSADISIPNNWWGTTSTSAIDQSIYDFNDDFNLGKVTYTPILTSENTAAYPDSSVPIPSTSPLPTLTPTAEPHSNSTAQPTTQPTQNPTVTSNPTEPTPQVPLSIDWATAVVIALLAVVAVLLAVNILYMRRRAAKP